MRNKYPGMCYRCSEHVAKGMGHFERILGAWRLQHAECAIKYKNLKSEQVEGVSNEYLKRNDQENLR